MSILKNLYEKHTAGKKSMAVLIDPDKVTDDAQLRYLVNLASESCVDYFFVGGSLITTTNLGDVIRQIRQQVSIPIVLFPGNAIQVDPQADAILFLSLISGRNPELLIGQHVVAAPIIRNTSLEVLPTGYLLIGSGRTTSVAYVSNTIPIPDDKYSLAACTAMAGEMLGLKLMYLDAGSGAESEISGRMISAVRKSVSLPIIVGGGINSPVKAQQALEAGADVIVIGNALEKNPDLLAGIANKVYEWNEKVGVKNG
jgi:putative glycerol-1-phosphate prenyltransferase